MRRAGLLALMVGALFVIAHPSASRSNTVTTSIHVTMNVPDSCSLSTPSTPPPAGFTAGSFLSNCTQPNVSPVLTVTAPSGTTFGQPVVNTVVTPGPGIPGTGNAGSTVIPIVAATVAPDDSAGHILQAVLVPGVADATGAVTTPAPNAGGGSAPARNALPTQTPAPFDDSFVATINF